MKAQLTRLGANMLYLAVLAVLVVALTPPAKAAEPHYWMTKVTTSKEKQAACMVEAEKAYQANLTAPGSPQAGDAPGFARIAMDKAWVDCNTR